jgi:hypothetical protein
MALLVLGQLLPEEALGAAFEHVVLHDGGKLAVERFIAAQEARVEQRRLHLEVLRRQPDTLAHVAHSVADGEARVPQGVQDALADVLDVRFALVRIQEEEIDVGARIELATPVATLRDDGAALVQARRALGVDGACSVEECADQVIHRGGVSLDDFVARAAACVAFEQLGLHRLQVGARLLAPVGIGPQQSQGGVRRTHRFSATR